MPEQMGSPPLPGRCTTPFWCCTGRQVSVLHGLLHPEPGLTLCLGAASGGVVPSSCLGPSWVPILTFLVPQRDSG